MSGAAPTREVAYRVFADEFAEATYSYAESDDERAPQYLVTPTGARINRIFVVGVLTETEEVSDGVLRARIVDPTGAFVLYAGQYQPEALAFFERADPPMFVSLTGKARTFEPDGSDRVLTSLRPEQVNEVDSETRDSWVVQTALHTLERTGVLGQALELEARDEELSVRLTAAGVEPGLAAGIPHAIREYEPTTGYIEAIQQMALDAVRVVAGEIEEVSGVTGSPKEGGTGEVLTGFTDITLRSESAESTEPEPALAKDTDQPESGGAEPEVIEPTDEETGHPEASDQAEEGASETEKATGETEKRPGETDETGEETREETGDKKGEPEPETDGEEPEPETDDEKSEPETVVKELEPETDAKDSGSEVATESGEQSATEEEEKVKEEVPAEEPTDTDELYELSEEERAEVEENYDVGFESGAEIGSPEETEDIEPEAGSPKSDGEASQASEPGDDADEATVETEQTTSDSTAEKTKDVAETDAEDEPATEADDQETETEASELSEGERQDLVIDTLKELGEGEGVPRSELIETLENRHGMEEAEIEEAIEAALLGGRCFESGAEDLKPI